MSAPRPGNIGRTTTDGRGNVRMEFTSARPRVQHHTAPEPEELPVLRVPSVRLDLDPQETP